MSYAKYKKDELILRDDLAIDRTVLAIERTLLSYLRFCIALIIAGITIINLSRSGSFSFFGGVCIVLGIAAGVVGLLRFYILHKRLSKIQGR